MQQLGGMAPESVGFILDAFPKLEPHIAIHYQSEKATKAQPQQENTDFKGQILIKTTK